MISRILVCGLALMATSLGASTIAPPASAATPQAPSTQAPSTPAAILAADTWRTVEPQNLLVVDTTKGRILVELDPVIAPRHVERLQVLTRRGFYDGLKFHRVIPGFMAQTGDPAGTGAGGSDLPDVQAELGFRRTRGQVFQPLSGGAGQPVRGFFDAMPVQTQPDAQMFVTADMKVATQPLFCPSVVGMARTGDDLNSANSQFFMMTGQSDVLNGAYTAFGRVIDGLTVVKAMNAGSDKDNGAVANADMMTRVRLADAIPEAERPVVRVMDPRSPTFVARAEALRAARGLTFNICDVEVPVEATGG